MPKKIINKLTNETISKSITVYERKAKIEKKRMDLFKSMKEYIVELTEKCNLIDFDVLTTNDVAKIRLTVISENKMIIVFLINSTGMKIELDNILTKYGSNLVDACNEVNSEYEKLLEYPIPESIMKKLESLQKSINEK